MLNLFQHPPIFILGGAAGARNDIGVLRHRDNCHAELVSASPIFILGGSAGKRRVIIVISMVRRKGKPREIGGRKAAGPGLLCNCDGWVSIGYLER